ncbi:restriction endonuclease subunit S [Shewanella baltica]|uniref:restriction endonuclease subunit S n=1 Tax=Shewanella baltica TaxID=62322 RepID=UPI0021672F20|nr:restriction endonuclease subunit S [Shewanella baltica]MCS6116126.1 restriction endonuclease subunit S [Shewanella baltica]UVW62801.1 restriction endonuclease subunit S [Shewanella baltica]
MSQLSYMEKLLDGVEVEFKRLCDVVRIKNGKDHKSLGDGSFPVYGSGGVMRYADTYAYNKPSVLIPRKGSLGNLFFVDIPFWNVDTIFYTEIDEAQIIPKFFYYFLTTVGLGEMNQAGGVPSQTQSVLNELKIPIPCPDNPEKSLAIQAEIVRILDTFTAMTAELTAELNMRKKQYNYYRDQLLSFEDGDVEWKTLGEVAQLITKGTTPKEFVSDGVNFIKLESFDDNQIKPDKFMFITPEVHNKELKRSILEEGDILFAIAGATIGKCAIVDKSVLPANTNQALAIVRLTQQVNVKFAFYYMQTTAMTDYIAKFNKTSAQPNINLKQMSEFKIPVPTINEQIRIVKILDNFNTLTSSIKEGLPREIELRQKQYEYYRDLLLSFPKSDEAAA